MKVIILAGGRGTRLRTEAELRLRLLGYKRCVQPTSISGLRLGSRGWVIAREESTRTFLVTGSTGSVGRAFLTYALAQGMQEIWISSRDEFKQEVMRKELYDSPVKYYLSDVHDRASVDPAMERAALKEVLSCEFFPIQVVMAHTSIGPRRVIAGD